MFFFANDSVAETNTAILLLDFQNEFVRHDGKLHAEVQESMKETRMLQKIPRVVRVARENGAIVIHAGVVMEAGEKFKDEEWDPYAYGSMENLFTEGTWNCKFADEVKPEDPDIILKNRTNFSAFRGTNLKDVIESKGLTRLFLMGFLSNICIQETAKDACELFPELKIYVLSDGCAAKSKNDHHLAISTHLPLFADVITCSDALSLLRNRPRILALHGAQSNNDVTKLQLENLNITSKDYDITFLQGGIEVNDPHPDLEGFATGPFYSWFDDQDKSSVINAVRDVVKAVQAYGPFDGIYGFSSGAVVASLVANLSEDSALRELLAGNSKKNPFRFSVLSGFSIRIKTDQSSMRLTQSMRAMFSGNTNLDVSKPLFAFAILACMAPDVSLVRKNAGVKNIIKTGTIPVRSFHLVGIEDKFKAISEMNASLYGSQQIMYMHSGHAVTRSTTLDKELQSSLRKFAQRLGNPSTRKKFLEKSLNYAPMSEVSSVHLLKESQVALVKLNRELLPEGLFENGATIRGALQAQPGKRPFIYNARNADDSAATTYGDVLNFIDGGKGDLRALGITQGEVVAYVSPPGGSAIAAVAFLSIASQTAAAPLAPSTAEPDALDALDQFNAKHLILFEGVDCPGVKSAFEQYSQDGKAKIHYASPLGNKKPGLFEYQVEGMKSFHEENLLLSREDQTSLLLRTSGTTARPKGVPLTQGSLITNGAIIAKSMQLSNSDVCYSIMPLFHIGGISASILCTLTSGGSVVCDAEPFSPSRMVDALAISNPQPTWYSSVPTIHNATVNFLKNAAAGDPKYNAYGIDSNGVWTKGHSLRMIRSGAAALLGPDGEALSAAYGGVPIYPTYSMSEQMPISQPPAGKKDTMNHKPGSVGVPVAASTAIVSRATLRPQPPGVEGEVAISGPTVLKNYLNNPEADEKSYFYLSLKEEQKTLPYFLTGDVGVLDSDGFLSLKGRAKELIKKGGEQVSPFEVEAPLLDHPWVQTPVCFSVPSKLYGEEVGCAIILSPNAIVNKADDDALKIVSTEMRAWLKEAKLAPIKWPTKWKIVEDDELPKTKSKKYIRIGLSTHLGLDPKEAEISEVKKRATAKIDWEVIGGFRFILACYVMFMHIGSNESWGCFTNLRGWPWHVHVFFTLGGYSMASPMNPIIQKKFSYFMARINAMYPMYFAALIFGLINLLIVCRPSTFRPDFHWDGQPDDLYLEDGSLSPLFCEGTPATPTSYWGSLFLTIFTYIFGLAVTPFWPMNWWLGYYLWFSSMYYWCLACFPAMYNYFFTRTRGNIQLLLRIMIVLLLLNVAITIPAWYSFKDMEGYGHYEPTGRQNSPEDYSDGAVQNIGILSFYLFGPFWQLYFIIGICAAFLYDAYRPAEGHNARRWGSLADSITLLMIGYSVAIILQGVDDYSGYPLKKYMRTDEANEFTDSSSTNRLWDNLSGRFFAPITTLWVFALSTGEGFTAKILRSKFLSQTLAPNAYNCFLFHQMVGQWYYALTRNGTMWNWWRFRKSMYWFSPEPCPVEWYEYFYLVILVVGFSSFMNDLEPIIGSGIELIKGIFIETNEEEEEDIEKMLCKIVENMTGIEPMVDYTLEECGLASIGIPVLVNLLDKNFSTQKRRLNITASDLVSAKTIGDMTKVIHDARSRADAPGI